MIRILASHDQTLSSLPHTCLRLMKEGRTWFSIKRIYGHVFSCDGCGKKVRKKVESLCYINKLRTILAVG